MRQHVPFEIWNKKQGRHMPIIAMTANAFAEDIQEAMKAGMDAHVAKPIDMPAS